MKNVLIFPCGLEIIFEIYWSVKHSKHFRWIGVNIILNDRKFVYENYISGVPFVSNEIFASVIKQIAKKYDIDYIFPFMNCAVSILKENEKRIGLLCHIICVMKNLNERYLCKILRIT